MNEPKTTQQISPAQTQPLEQPNSRSALAAVPTRQTSCASPAEQTRRDRTFHPNQRPVEPDLRLTNIQTAQSLEQPNSRSALAAVAMRQIL
ncbi:hypothetical protein LOC71_00295 [Rhodopirellula sp. JC740]|uniref:Uncharacterized protein n=1 Tax=Rhodopirellula halodulae TaxID=2894198 RepID=A0ABS8NAU9_9BACT|nr:hypothetical protein [Rhodopirellula sp. JC740]MCC9640696.1 hypothetical protein [Rhodopirellula sp. JC740]